VYDNSAGRLTMSAFAITGLTLMVRPSTNDGAYSAETFDPMLKVSIHQTCRVIPSITWYRAIRATKPVCSQPCSTTLRAYHSMEIGCPCLLEHC